MTTENPTTLEPPKPSPVRCSDLLGAEYARLGITIGENMRLSKPVLVNVLSGVMHNIEEDGSVACPQCRLLFPVKSNDANDIRNDRLRYAILEHVSRMPYIACRVCEDRA